MTVTRGRRIHLRVARSIPAVMTLAEQFSGIPFEPSLANRERYCEWLKQQHPNLTKAELERQWHERNAQHHERYGFVAGT